MDHIRNNKIFKWTVIATAVVMFFGFSSQALAACDSTPNDPFASACADLYTISGQSFDDVNQNGINDSETGLAGRTITLTNGVLTRTVITDANGNYSFNDLEAGTYTVCEQPLTDWTQTAPTTTSGCYEVVLADRMLYSMACPMMVKTGRVIVEFNNTPIRSDLAEVFSYSGPVLASIISGNYDLTLLSYDNHFSDITNELQEQWYLVLQNQLGHTVVSTSSISDLPLGDNWIVEQVETNFSILEDITSMTAVHMAYPDASPNTITPKCAAFDLITKYDFGSYYTAPVVPILGCTDSSATNYDSTATQDNGTCTYPVAPILGCTDSSATNYNPLATVDDGTCTYPPVVISGCTDPSATNYVVGATVDNGSCQYPPVDKPGCTNSAALNYDPTATVDNGHCEFGGGSTPQPKLIIKKTVNKELVNAGETVIYTIVIENKGQAKTEQSVLWDSLPEGFTYEDDGAITKKWEIGNIYKNEKKTFSFNVLISENVKAGIYNSEAKVTSANYQTIKADVDVEVRGVVVKGAEVFPKLEVEKTVNNLNPKAGSYILYTIKIINTGEAVAENIRITDILPEGFINGDDNLAKINWIIPTLEIGKKWEKTFSVYIKSTVKSGSYENIVSVEADNNPKVQGSVIVKIGVLPHTAGGVENFFDLYRLGSSLAKIEKDWLVIPSIGVEIPVVIGNSESALEKGAWLLPGGSIPSAGGNTAFAAHRYKYRPPHKQTFYLLDKVKIGDSVEIYWKGELYNYVVFETIVVSPDEIGVLNQTDESIITLITCTPLFSDKHRLIVKAKLI